MTRVTFGVSSSSFVANMAVKQNANELAHEDPLAAKAVTESFYVNDCLTGADPIKLAVQTCHQLRNMFVKVGFLLRKWKSSCLSVLQDLPPEIRDSQTSLTTDL